MNYIPTLLFEHMKIGMIIYTSSMALTANEIQNTAKNMGISEYSLSLAIKDLILHGIISANFSRNHEIIYIITEFGRYFYNKFCSEEADAKKLCEDMRGEKQ